MGVSGWNGDAVLRDAKGKVLDSEPASASAGASSGQSSATKSKTKKKKTVSKIYNGKLSDAELKPGNAYAMDVMISLTAMAKTAAIARSQLGPVKASPQLHVNNYMDGLVHKLDVVKKRIHLVLVLDGSRSVSVDSDGCFLRTGAYYFHEYTHAHRQVFLFQHFSAAKWSQPFLCAVFYCVFGFFGACQVSLQGSDTQPTIESTLERRKHVYRGQKPGRTNEIAPGSKPLRWNAGVLPA